MPLVTVRQPVVAVVGVNAVGDVVAVRVGREASVVQWIRAAGLLETTKALLPHFRANKGGVIVNVSPIGGKYGLPLGTLYHGAKIAVEGLSEALSYEMAAIGVKVKIVEPGRIKTDFVGRSLDFSNDESLTEYQEFVGNMLAGRAAAAMVEGGSEPEVVAEVIYQAATDGTDQLRYAAGPDAAQTMANRKAVDDATFSASIRARFGIS